VASTHAKRSKQGFPILEGILPIDPSRISIDVIAGATLAALAIPEVMGYTKIAGTPVITGLYTIILPIIAFAILGSSRHLVVGADSASAAILATGLVAMGAVADSTQYVELASLAALMCGAVLILARVLKLGFIANFLSRSVLIGFLTGVGIQVAMGQFGALFGVPGQSGTTIQKFVESVKLIPTDINVPTTVVSAFVLITIIGLGMVNKKIPGALLAVIVSIVASYALNLQADGVTILGTIPSGLPPIGLPTAVMTTQNITTLLPTVVSLVIVILAQSAATSRAYAMKYSDSFDENVDLVGLGAANFAAGISGTFVVNGSPTKTEMVDSAGGKTQIAQLTAAAIVVIVLLFLTVPLSYMPNAVLAAVVFLIGLRLVDYKGMADIYRLRKGEFAVAAITAATVVIVGVEQGILLAIFLSIIEHIYHSYRPYDTMVVQTSSGAIESAGIADAKQSAPGLALYRFGASIYYANAAKMTEEIMELAEDADPPLRWFILVGSAIGDIDYSGADSVRQIQEELSRKHVTFGMTDLSPHVRSQLDEYGLTDKIGKDNIHGSIGEVVVAYLRLGPPAATSPADDTPADDAPAPA
jgi:sulfate permease, SulP family